MLVGARDRVHEAAARDDERRPLARRVATKPLRARTQATALLLLKVGLARRAVQCDLRVVQRAARVAALVLSHQRQRHAVLAPFVLVRAGLRRSARLFNDGDIENERTTNTHMSLKLKRRTKHNMKLLRTKSAGNEA